MSQRRDQEVALSRTLPTGLATIWLYQWICCTASVTMNVWGTNVGADPSRHGSVGARSPTGASTGLVSVPDPHHLPVHRTAQLIKSPTRGATRARVRARPDRPGRGGGRGGEHADPGAAHRRLGHLRRRDPDRRWPGPKSRKRYLLADRPSSSTLPRPPPRQHFVADRVRGVT